MAKSKTAIKSVKKEVKKASSKPAKKSAAKKSTQTKSAMKAKPKAAAKPAQKAAPKVAAKAPNAAKGATGQTASMKLTMMKGGKSAFLMPLDDRLLVEKLVASDRTPGGLYIPDMAQERPTKGKVIAVGSGHRDAKGRIRPLDVKIGDVVLFTQWSGSEIELDGTTYLIMRETDLLGVSTD